MGFNDKFALQKILNGRCPLWSWLFSNSGRALAFPAADGAVCLGDKSGPETQAPGSSSSDG
jgi:hypothetical protein